MERNVRSPSLLLRAAGLLLSFMIPIAVVRAQVPSTYVDNSVAASPSFNRGYNLGYMNSISAASSFGPYSAQRNDVSAVGDNPASGISNMDLPNAGFIGYVPDQRDRYVSTLIVAVKPSDNVAWHVVLMIKGSGAQTIRVQSPSAYTGQMIDVYDRQEGIDYRLSAGFSFHPASDSRWSMGASLNVYNSSVLTGTINLNSKNWATAATMDVGIIYNAQNEDGAGGTFGFRLKNLSFLNGVSTLRYSPGTTAAYDAQYGMTRYIPGYAAIGGGYRFQLESDQQLTVSAETGLEMNHAVPGIESASAMKEYESRGAFSNMLSVSGFISTLNLGYSKSLSEELSINGHGGLVLDPHNKNPYVSAGIGHSNFHANLGYIFASNANPFGHQLSLTVRLGFKGR